MINNYLERQIKENFSYQPTFEQEIAVKSLSEFLLSTANDTVFVLRGYAGTGKTSLVGALVKAMDKLQQKSVLLAPTGRAAKVFSAYAGHPAFTIHKKIYRQQSFSNEVSNFSINDNLTTHTLYIVDEASMISNEGLSGSMFGTGRLLDDLVYICYASIMGPINFEKAKKHRDKAVVARLIDIRKAQAEYRNIYKQYTASFDTLIDFVKTQKIPFVSKEGVLSDKQLEDGMTEKKAMALINKAKKTNNWKEVEAAGLMGFKRDTICFF